MTRRPLTAFFILAAIVVIAGYGAFEARRLLEGPLITISMPADGSSTSSMGVVIAGTAQNISFLTINDLPWHTDEQGNFSELLSIPPGFTVLTVAAVDRFGRRTSKSVSIQVLDYCPVDNA